MPAAVQTEALSQMITVAFTTLPGIESVDVVGSSWSAKFHREVRPGDRLDIEAFVKSYTRGVGRGYAKGYVDGELACEAELTLVIPCELNKYKPKRRIGDN